MALKLNLKENEKIVIGGAVIRNGSRHIELYVENNVPILRQKDIMTEQEVNTPARRIYFAIQLMYIDADNMITHQGALTDRITEIVEAAPSTRPYLLTIAEYVADGKLYQALKAARQLIDYEKELLAHA